MEKKCGNCIYFEWIEDSDFPELEDSDIGECHRFPPTSKVVDTVASRHERVRRDDWCGEYRRGASKVEE